ncbi:MAG: hypothetical protein ACYC64_13550 [Armatimonadota bacterium]
METQEKPSSETASAGASALPHSLDILSDCLAKFIPPEGPFDPQGSWDHCYTTWIALRVDASHEHGALRIRRAVGASGGVTLSISQRIGPTITNTTGHTAASVTLSSRNAITDRLAAPGRWEIESRILNAKGDVIPYSKTRVTGEVSQGSIVIRTQAERKFKAPKAFTGNWSLFDAVQRLPFDTDPIQFEMLEDMELLKPRQKLMAGPTIEAVLNGRKLRLHSFEHIGEGILPNSYWLDDQHRLLIAVGGVRAFIWDPTARLPEDAQ